MKFLLCFSLVVGPVFADSLREALSSGRYRDALLLADSLLNTSPNDPKLWTARGMALTGLGQRDESLAAFDHALEIQPDFIPALRGAAETAYRSQSSKTEEYLNRLITLEPANGVARAMAGVVAYERRDCPTAVKHFGNAQRELSANEQASSMYGRCLLVLNRASEALPLFAKLVAAHPDDVRQRLNLANAQLAAAKPAEAMSTLQPLTGTSPPLPEVLNLLASAEAANGRLESAITHLREAIRLAPRDEDNYLDLIELCMQNESSDTAAEIVGYGLQAVPESARLHAARGALKARLGSFDEAAAEFELANRLDPEQRYGSTGLGLLYTAKNDSETATAVLRERLTKSPNDATLNVLYAEGLLQGAVEPGTARFRDAVAALKSAIRSKPEFARAHSLLGKAYVKTNDYTQAIEQLRLALRYDPSNRMALSNLIVAFQRTGREQEASAAVAALKKVIASEAQPRAHYSRIQITDGDAAAARRR